MKVLNKGVNLAKAFVLPVAVWLVFSIITHGRFATLTSFLSVLRTAVVPMLLAMSLSFGMTMGMWNFSSGAVVYACAIFSARIAEIYGLGIPGVCILSLLIGLAASAVMGGLYRYTRIPCLVLSLGFAMIVEALPGIMIKSGTGKIGLFDGYLGGAPWCYIIAIIMFAIFCYINSCTTFGANIKAIGANIKIADSAGINIDRVKFASFLVSGLFLGVAGIIYISINVSVISVTGFTSAIMIFDGIMGIFVAQVLTKYINYNAAVIIGTITIRMLGAGLVACGFSSEIRGILTGVFLFLVVTYSANAGFIDRIKSKKAVAAKANAEFSRQEA
jgi:ribose transport system permease protein